MNYVPPNFSEFPLLETHGFNQLATCRALQTSAGRRWEKVYVSTQIEGPNEETFPGSPHLFVSLIRSGATKLVCRNETREGRANLRPGHLNILAPGQPIHLKWDRRVHTTHLYLRGAFLSQLASDLGKDDDVPVEILSRLAVIDPLLEGLIGAIGEAMELSPEISYHYVENLSRAVGCWILRKYSNVRFMRPAEETSRGLSKRQIACFKEIVETRMNQKLSLTDLAEGSGLSVHHFAYLFKQTTGNTPYQYLLHSRIQRARYLLAKTSTPVMQIAADCGFSDHVHFTKVFSKIVGQPPGAFRKLADK